MEDSRIVELYWKRDADAIPATSEKYGGYCASIAQNILGNEEDAEECVNDTWLGAWNSMPPHRPSVLQAFLGKITRNLSFNRHRRDRAEKRGGGELPLVLDELGECVSGTDSVGNIAARVGMTESNVSMTLTRLRRKLREHLTKGGFEL